MTITAATEPAAASAAAVPVRTADAPAFAAARSRFQGFNLVLRSNVTQYLAGVAVLLAGGAAFTGWLTVPNASWLWLAVAIATVPGLFWFFSSLLITWYVYDCSALYRWSWLPERLPFPPRQWTVIHAGLDDASASFRRMFPRGVGRSLDVYHPARTTEPSIIRARNYLRRTHRQSPAAAADALHLPLADDSIETHFLILAIHELRQAQERDQFFDELDRTLRPGGVVVLVEHFRDPWNFLAFGPGFRHFLPRREWQRLIARAGWESLAETTITPFVHAVFLRKPQYAPLGEQTVERYTAVRETERRRNTAPRPDNRTGQRQAIAALHLFDGPR